MIKRRAVPYTTPMKYAITGRGTANPGVKDRYTEPPRLATIKPGARIQYYNTEGGRWYAPRDGDWAYWGYVADDATTLS